jgi:hypothetical protein
MSTGTVMIFTLGAIGLSLATYYMCSACIRDFREASMILNRTNTFIRDMNNGQIMTRYNTRTTAIVPESNIIIPEVPMPITIGISVENINENLEIVEPD